MAHQEYSRIKQKDTSTTKITLQLVLFSRLLVFLLMSPILSRLGHGFSWRWAFIMVWSEMKGTPNINMALLLAYSDISLGSERERSQVRKAMFSYLGI
jgi:NhaP-type Na+/H+ or K+/H+ antiporter